MEAVATAVKTPQLPARLLQFFAKYPPQLYGVKYTAQAIPLTKQDAKLVRISQAEEEEQKKAIRQAELEAQKDARRRKTETDRRKADATQRRIAAANAILAQRGILEAYIAPARPSRETRPELLPSVFELPAITNIRYPTLANLERSRQQIVKDAIAAAELDPDAQPKIDLSATPVLSMPSITSPKYTTLAELANLEKTSKSHFPHNPFLPKRIYEKGPWNPPLIGLRRQAELFKLAKKHGVEALLPASRKSTEFQQDRLLNRGLRVRGTGVGQKVKGHKWERQYEEKMEERYKAIVNMPALVREWQRRGHGKGLRKDQYPRVKLP